MATRPPPPLPAGPWRCLAQSCWWRRGRGPKPSPPGSRTWTRRGAAPIPGPSSPSRHAPRPPGVGDLQSSALGQVCGAGAVPAAPSAAHCPRGPLQSPGLAPACPCRPTALLLLLRPPRLCTSPLGSQATQRQSLLGVEGGRGHLPARLPHVWGPLASLRIRSPSFSCPPCPAPGSSLVSCLKPPGGAPLSLLLSQLCSPPQRLPCPWHPALRGGRRQQVPC